MLFRSEKIKDIYLDLNLDNSIDVNFGVGIHHGKMILGTIGESNRLDDTAISDTVNTASRIENLAEKNNVAILVSKKIKDIVEKENLIDISFSSLGSMAVKGKKKPISLFSCRNIIEEIYEL